VPCRLLACRPHRTAISTATPRTPVSYVHICPFHCVGPHHRLAGQIILTHMRPTRPPLRITHLIHRVAGDEHIQLEAALQRPQGAVDVKRTESGEVCYGSPLPFCSVCLSLLCSDVDEAFTRGTAPKGSSVPKYLLPQLTITMSCASSLCTKHSAHKQHRTDVSDRRILPVSHTDAI